MGRVDAVLEPLSGPARRRRYFKSETAGPTPCRPYEPVLSYLLRLTAFLSSAPAENLATLRAAILMVAPV
jgi:hypothetical protein